MRHGERDEFGRLNVTDEELVAHARGAMIAAALSIESIMVLLGCEWHEALAFKEGAWADVSRIRHTAPRHGVIGIDAARERAAREGWGAGWFGNPAFDGPLLPQGEALDSGLGERWAAGGDDNRGHVRDLARAGNQHGRNGSWWAGADWIVCHDDKARRIADARAPLLVNGFPGRVLAWRGFGNAIVPPLAAEAIAALADILPPWSPS